MATSGTDKAVTELYTYDSQRLLAWRKGTDHIVVVTAVLVS